MDRGSKLRKQTKAPGLVVEGVSVCREKKQKKKGKNEERKGKRVVMLGCARIMR